MWDLGNRDIIVLVSVISGCAILCNIFGPYLAFTITFVLIVCGWFTYIVADDTPFTPHALLAFNYLAQTTRELNVFLANACHQSLGYLTVIADAFACFYRKHIIERMSQRRRSTYQLSADTRGNSRNSSRFSLIGGLSPISRGAVRNIGNSVNVENSPYLDTDSRLLERASSLGLLTSTPLVIWRKEDVRNGDIFPNDHGVNNRNSWKNSHTVSQNHTLSRGGESTYSPEGSPWGTSISPKMRARASGVKTVQTVAGPLLASTRYNIDPKIYSDVTSPGLTSRLTKYATEANTKLTHQSQYGTGQFPRVNLNSSPTPMINAKTGKLRMPVTVRVAPPESTRYSPPERQQMLSEICHVESKGTPSVVQVLREISLKRHASREDVTFELAKKQRTDGVFSDDLENLEEMTQKRARDDSSRSEEDISPPNKALRPAKRSKMPSCHDILSSLSSSISVSSGVKRKAIDVSRSGTPDVGKHFKSLDSSQAVAAISPSLSGSVYELTRPNKRILNEPEARNSDLQSPSKKMSIPGKRNVSPGEKILNKASGDSHEKELSQPDAIITRERSNNLPTRPIKLTDRLFMKAEPQNIDKIKTLIEEHGSTKPRFTTDSSEEIKKSDIVNMRQTSMKIRLKSMFDAISGKASSKINPEVVIQAEEKSPSSQLIAASLSSTTSTTNVNTSPIATSAIVPIIGKTKPTTTPAKHVTFQFTNSEESPGASIAETVKTSTIETKADNPVESQVTKKLENPIVEKPSQGFTFVPSVEKKPHSCWSVGQAKNLSTPFSTVVTPRNSSSFPASVSISSVSKSSPTSLVTTTSSSPRSNSQIFNTTTTSLFGTPTETLTKSISSPVTSFTQQDSDKTAQTSVSFAFGAQKTGVLTRSDQSSSLKSIAPSPQTSSSEIVTSTSVSSTAVTSSGGLFGFGAAPKPIYSETPASGFGNPSSTASSLFGGDPQKSEKKSFTFGPTTPVASAIFEAPIVTTTGQSVSNVATTASIGSGFNFTKSNASPIFGTMTPCSTAPSTGFSSSTSTASAFTFGTNTTSTVAAKSEFSFVTSPATSTVATTVASVVPSLSFGVTSNTIAPLFGGPPKTSSSTISRSNIFGAPATTTSTTTAQPVTFGTPATTSLPTMTQTNIFGPPATNSSGFANGTASSGFGTTNAASPSFSAASGATSTFGTPKTMETPSFGTGTIASSTFAATSASSSLFSGVTSETNAPATVALPSFANTTFGQKPPPPFGATVTTNFSSNASGTSLFVSQANETFGNSNTATRGVAPIYGFPNASTTTFGVPSTAPPAFGATNTSTTSFGTVTTATPAFGAISTATSTFGTQNSVPGTIGNSNATSSSFNAPSVTFSATTTAPPAFATSITPSSSFGNSGTGAFGNSSNPPPAFNGATSNFTGFGATSGGNVAFGAQVTPGTSTFGTTSSGNTGFGSSANNNANTSFTFGASQSAPQQPQQTAVFAFGGGPSTSGNNVIGGATPFQFGTPAPQPGGFNFTGASATPAINFTKDGTPGGSFSLPAAGANSFSAPATGGMFNIGTGSTAPRSRPSRRRQR